MISLVFLFLVLYVLIGIGAVLILESFQLVLERTNTENTRLILLGLYPLVIKDALTDSNSVYELSGVEIVYPLIPSNDVEVEQPSD